MSDENSAALHPKIFVLKIVVDQDVACFHVVPLVGGEASNDLQVRKMVVCPLKLLTSCPALIYPESWHTGQNDWFQMPRSVLMASSARLMCRFGSNCISIVSSLGH
jgi:hypothetical protein